MSQDSLIFRNQYKDDFDNLINSYGASAWEGYHRHLVQK